MRSAQQGKAKKEVENVAKVDVEAEVETEGRKLSNDVDDCPNSLQKIMWLYTQPHADTHTHTQTWIIRLNA